MNMNIGTVYDRKFFEPMSEGQPGAGKANANTKTKAGNEAAAEWIKEIKGTPEKTSDVSDISKKNESELSDKAKEFLANIREKYGAYDFFVGKNDDEFDALSGSGSKEFSVIISMDEIEKMANDEDYAAEKMQMVEGAIEMAKKITEESGYKFAGEGDGEKGTINKVSITIGDDGGMKIFAELEKSSAKQSERIAKNREKHAEEKKAQEKAAIKKNPYEKKEKDVVKRTTVEADSFDEFMKKLQEVDWDKIAGSKSGDKFNFTA